MPVAGSKTTLRQAVIDPTAPATSLIVVAHKRDRGATLEACAIAFGATLLALCFFTGSARLAALATLTVLAIVRLAMTRLSLS